MIDGIKKEAKIMPLSEWQKPDCLLCDDTATQEVVYKSAHIRCCKKQDCIDFAKNIAIKADF